MFQNGFSFPVDYTSVQTTEVSKAWAWGGLLRHQGDSIQLGRESTFSLANQASSGIQRALKLGAGNIQVDSTGGATEHFTKTITVSGTGPFNLEKFGLFGAANQVNSSLAFSGNFKFQISRDENGLLKITNIEEEPLVNSPLSPETIIKFWPLVLLAVPLLLVRHPPNMIFVQLAKFGNHKLRAHLALLIYPFSRAKFRLVPHIALGFISSGSPEQALKFLQKVKANGASGQGTVEFLLAEASSVLGDAQEAQKWLVECLKIDASFEFEARVSPHLAKFLETPFQGLI